MTAAAPPPLTRSRSLACWLALRRRRYSNPFLGGEGKATLSFSLILPLSLSRCTCTHVCSLQRVYERPRVSGVGAPRRPMAGLHLAVPRGAAAAAPACDDDQAYIMNSFSPCHLLSPCSLSSRDSFSCTSFFRARRCGSFAPFFSSSIFHFSISSYLDFCARQLCVPREADCVAQIIVIIFFLLLSLGTAFSCRCGKSALRSLPVSQRGSLWLTRGADQLVRFARHITGTHAQACE